MSNNPLVSWAHWASLDCWTLSQTNALFCNSDPLTITNEPWPAFIADLESTHEFSIKKFPLVRLGEELTEILVMSRLILAAEDAGAFGKPLKPNHDPWARKYAPAVLVEWAQRKKIELPKGLVAAVKQFSEQPTYDEFRAELDEARAENAELKKKLAEYEAAPIAPRVRRSLLLTIGGLSLALAKLHRRCRMGEDKSSKPNVSGLIGQIHLEVPHTTPGMSEANLERYLSEALGMVPPRVAGPEQKTS